jgi:hypothetical protein
MTFTQPIEIFIEQKMVFVSKLYMKALYLDMNQNGFETVVKNIFEISYVTALRLHSLLASFYFAKKKKLPSSTFCNDVFYKICGKMKNAYLKLDLKPSANIQLNLMSKIIRYSFHHVLKGKFSSFYKDQILPKPKSITELPMKILHQSIKERQTFRIKSHSYQRF